VARRRLPADRRESLCVFRNCTALNAPAGSIYDRLYGNCAEDHHTAGCSWYGIRLRVWFAEAVDLDALRIRGDHQPTSC